MKEFEKHMREGTGSNRSYILPTEVKRRRALVGRTRPVKNSRCVNLNKEIAELEGEVLSLARFIIRHMSASEKELNRAYALRPEFEEAIGDLLKEGVLTLAPARRAYTLITKIPNIISTLRKVYLGAKAAEELADAIIGIKDLIGDFKEFIDVSRRIISHLKSAKRLSEGAERLAKQHFDKNQRAIKLRKEYERLGCSRS